ncbi:hypothetical protein OG792_31925 [Micromonospora sp. NBC_01699]|uniref:hypothetical protein n=1 Tax=Micromonospora sp. NBC_01699 TaxID=2975984 RepID=UPI002E297210|nr:hypothetical protein [Micromonospora sp. NBC_01699]
MVNYVYAYVSNRLAELRGEADRGDGPVPTAVIIVGLAILAAALIVTATDFVTSWTDELPDAPAGGGGAVD